VSCVQESRSKIWCKGILPLGVLLAVDLLAALAVAWKVPFQAPNPSYLCDAKQLMATHRISTSFLPVGYSGVLGWSGMLAGQAGIVGMSILMSLAVIAAAWIYLRSLGVSVRLTLVLTALLSLYPDLLLSYNKAQDTALTAVLLFLYVTLLLRAVKAQRFGVTDALLGLLLGYAVMVRPNLVLLVPLVWFVFWRFRVPAAGVRLFWQTVLVVGFYALGTTAIHGRPFLPQNGPYNLYAGANEFTAEHIQNEEGSLIEAMALHGIKVIDPDSLCIADSGDPEVADIHERRLDPVYRKFALQFMREHPLQMVKLMGLKFMALLSPDFMLHRPGSLGGMFKILSAAAFPLWLLAFLLWPQSHPGPAATRLVVVLTVLCYVVPFLLTVSSSRFRVPLDFFLWMDLGAIVAARWARQRQHQADRGAQACFGFRRRKKLSSV
jgi:hypothetical protein